MPSDKGEIVLGVDLDGVCADFYARMREIAAEWLEVGLETLTTDVSYGLTEWGIRDDDHYRQLHRFAVTQRDFFETCPPIHGAGPTLRRLSDEGYRVRIITHRLFINFFHEASVRQTIRGPLRHLLREQREQGHRGAPGPEVGGRLPAHQGATPGAEGVMGRF
jgi:hypothetical protein